MLIATAARRAPGAATRSPATAARRGRGGWRRPCTWSSRARDGARPATPRGIRGGVDPRHMGRRGRRGAVATAYHAARRALGAEGASPPSAPAPPHRGRRPPRSWTSRSSTGAQRRHPHLPGREGRVRGRTGAFEHHLVVPGRDVTGRRHARRVETATASRSAAALDDLLLRARARRRTAARPVLGAARARRRRAAPVIASTTPRATSRPPRCPARTGCTGARSSRWLAAATSGRRRDDGRRPRSPRGAQAALPLRFGLDPRSTRAGSARGGTCCTPGRLSREKGVIELLEAAARRRTPWPLRIVGCGQAEGGLARARRRARLARRSEPFIDDRAALARAYAAASLRRHARSLRDVRPGRARGRGVAAPRRLRERPVGARAAEVAHTFRPGDVRGLLAAIERRAPAARPARRRPDRAAPHLGAGVRRRSSTL